jgi:hypothetical protein
MQARNTGLPPTRVECEACHFNEAKFQKNEEHLTEEPIADCIDCHMPRLVKSAYADAEAYSGDIRAHLWAIDPDALSQFPEDGSVAISQIALDFACKVCHRSDGPADFLTDEELRDSAINYHERP